MSKEIKRPNFIIIGAMKAATTSLYTYLKQHPAVFMTKVKEPMFFNNYKQDNNYKIMGPKKSKKFVFNQYLDLFDDARDETAIGEASPSYIYNHQAPALIKEKLPDVKIIAILRQPTDRAYSNFLHARRAGKEPLSSFEDSIKEEDRRIEDNWSPLYHYINKGYYTKQLERYYSVFPQDKIKVILFEDIVKSPQKTIRDIFNFLKVDSYQEIDFSNKANVSGDPKGILGWIVKKMRFYNIMPGNLLSRLPSFMRFFLYKLAYSNPKKMDKDLRKNITNRYYLDEIKKLEKMIDRDLSHWLG